MDYSGIALALAGHRAAFAFVRALMSNSPRERISAPRAEMLAEMLRTADLAKSAPATSSPSRLLLLSGRPRE